MKMHGRLREIVIILVPVLGTNAALTSLAHENSSTQARLAIEQLHKRDVEATLSGKADDFTKLWDDEAVRIQPGAPAEIGKAVIYADDKREEAKSGGGQNVCYRAEIKDLQIEGDWAFEWGYFSYKESASSKPGRGKVLRVIKRQPDGSWRFARVIGFTENVESAAPLSQPCE
jgi:ketosteroid isomerase-like protein